MGANVEYKGLKELRKAMENTGKNSEKKITSHLNKQAREFIKVAKENTPEDSGKLKESYVSMKVRKNFSDFDKPIRNKAPHHHLVNNGHNLTDKKGNILKYVPGKHYIEKTIADTEDDFNAATEEFINELFGDLL